MALIMNRIVFALVFVCVCSIAFGAAIPASTSSRVIYASQMGAKLNSNVYTGGGTDDSAALQAGLDLANNWQGYEFVVDGPALISTNLIIRSNTKLRFLSGAGLFMTAHSDCWPLGNQQNTNYATTNIVIEGGIINCNGNSQSEFTAGGHIFSGAPGVWGLWLAGVDHATVRDVTLLSPKCYSYLISDSRNVLLENISVIWTNNVAAGTNQLYGNDGVHIQGNIENVRLFGFYDRLGGDDVFALSTDETDYTLPVNDPRWTINSGSMSNIWLENIYADHCLNIGRTIMQSGHTNAHIYNFTLKDYHGNTKNNGWIAGPEHPPTGQIPIRNWRIDGMNILVEGGYLASLGLSPFSWSPLLGDSLMINNVRWWDNDNINGGAGSAYTSVFSLPNFVTNIIVNNVIANGGTLNGAANSALFNMDSTGSTNTPTVSINNASGFNLPIYAVACNDAATPGPPNGIWRVTNAQYDPSTTVNIGFTNFSNGDLGKLITTNWISGRLYTNTSGAIQFIQCPVAVTTASVAGGTRVDFVVGTGTTPTATNMSFGVQTVVGSTVTTNTGALTGYVLPSQMFTFSNAVVGAGNSARALPNGLQVTY